MITQFNTLKIILSGGLTVLFGIIITFTKRKISTTTRGDYNLKQLVIPFLFHLLALILCIAGIETSDTVAGMWILFVGFGFIQATPYLFQVNERVIFNLQISYLNKRFCILEKDYRNMLSIRSSWSRLSVSRTSWRPAKFSRSANSFSL